MQRITLTLCHWEVITRPIMFDKGTELVIGTSNVQLIEREARSNEELETGGMLYGKNQESSAIVLQVINPTIHANRSRTHFQIDEEFRITVANNMTKLGFDYLGSWHKHLGYGGPSPADDLEAEK